jgi:hypothetical protein
VRCSWFNFERRDRAVLWGWGHCFSRTVLCPLLMAVVSHTNVGTVCFASLCGAICRSCPAGQFSPPGASACVSFESAAGHFGALLCPEGFTLFPNVLGLEAGRSCLVAGSTSVSWFTARSMCMDAAPGAHMLTTTEQPRFQYENSNAAHSIMMLAVKLLRSAPGLWLGG